MKKIKKILLLLLVFISLGTLAGCAEKNVEGTLEEIMTTIYEGVTEKPMGLMNIDKETVEGRLDYYIGATDLEYEDILVSESAVGSIPHSVALIRMKENADIEAAKKAIKENINPNKWICVGVADENVIVKSKGNLIILILVDDENSRNSLEQGFDNL